MKGPTLNDPKKVAVIFAAGVNPTGIIRMSDASRRSEYASLAEECMKIDSRIKQFGFVEGNSNFQMSGGELRGSAALATAFIIADETGEATGSFTMSGIAGRVSYQVLPMPVIRYIVNAFKQAIGMMSEAKFIQCVFEDLKIEIRSEVLYEYYYDPSQFTGIPA